MILRLTFSTFLPNKKDAVPKHKANMRLETSICVYLMVSDEELLRPKSEK